MFNKVMTKIVGKGTTKIQMQRFWRRYWSFILLALLVASIASTTVLATRGEETSVATEASLESCDDAPVVQIIPKPKEIDFSVLSAELEKDDAAIEMGGGLASETAVSMDLPDVDTSAKTFMSYKAITDRSSRQWALQQEAKTNQYGFREIDGKYLIALGTYYSDHAGAMFRITLENGTVFEAITGDVKDNRDTDSKNQHRNGNLVEFIVDVPKLAKVARLMGDVSYTPGAGLNGSVKSIEYLGEYL